MPRKPLKLNWERASRAAERADRKSREQSLGRASKPLQHCAVHLGHHRPSSSKPERSWSRKWCSSPWGDWEKPVQSWQQQRLGEGGERIRRREWLRGECARVGGFGTGEVPRCCQSTVYHYPLVVMLTLSSSCWRWVENSRLQRDVETVPKHRLTEPPINSRFHQVLSILSGHICVCIYVCKVVHIQRWRALWFPLPGEP